MFSSIRSTPRILPRSLLFVLGILAIVLSVPGQTAGVSAFTGPLISAMSMSRAQLSLAYLIGTIASAVMLTPAGKIYDRLGSRATGTGVTVALALSLVGLTQAPRVLGMLAAAGIPSAAAALIIMSLGFFLIRFFGQGMMPLVGRTMVLKWFDDKRGAVSAVIGSVVPLAFAVAPPVFNGLISSFGMTGAWFIIAAVLAPGFALIVAFTFGDPPADYQPPVASSDKAVGLVMKLAVGWRSMAARAGRRMGLRPSKEPMRPERDLSLAEARRYLAFWVFLLVVTLGSVLITGLTFHVVAVFAEAGIGATAALAVFFPASLISVLITPIASMASDRLPLKYFAMMHAAALALFLIAIPLLSFGAPAYVLLVVSKGMASSMFAVNHTVVWPRFFGLEHLGSISGFSAAWFVAGSALGPYLFSLSVELTGSFWGVSYAIVPICLALLVVATRADNPNLRKARP
ncbi:MAG: MFS transporter [Spirochaetaceae bacterium]|nr:MAG: MFS transporter [Spirochaetaceae bacterium]